jgi:hypothetical protein
MDPILPRLIRSGGHHTTPVAGKAADNDRLAPVFRMIELFDRSVKGIQVGMDIIHKLLFLSVNRPVQDVKIIMPPRDFYPAGGVI